MRRASPILLASLALVAWSVGCRAQEGAQAPSVRDEFRRLVAGDRKVSALNPQPVSNMDVGNVKTERVRITPEEGHDAVVLIYKPKEAGKYPAVIVQHFLGGSKDHLAFATLLPMLAQKGFVVAAIDGRYRGERQNGKSLEVAMLEALRTGKGRPWLLDTTYDVLRLVDYLETREDVDPTRIGMTGFSEGGIITWMCSALDERIKASVPIIGVTSFADALKDSDGPETAAKLKFFEPLLGQYAKDLGEPGVTSKVLRTAWEKLVPGSTGRFDAPSLVPLIAPRPLLILNHEADELIPVAGARRVHELAQVRYRELKAEEKLDFRVAPGLKHADIGGLFADANQMTAWMERWLKVPAN